MSDQETPDNENVVAFKRKPKGEQAEKKRARATVPNPNLNVNSSEKLEPGDNVMCRIVRYVPGGFNVILIPQNLPAYLPSNSNHQAGDQICAIFVKAEKDRLLLSQRAAVDMPNKSTHAPFPNPGDNLICKIVRSEEGGYEVFIEKFNWPGYLPSNAKHAVGDEVLGTFVCVDKQRMLISERFTHGKGDLVRFAPDEDEDDSD
jgi:hypothetical protein